jgi:hypothetical protein
MNFATTSRLLTAPKSLKIIAESSGLVLLFVNQLGIDLYEVYDAEGEFLHLSVTEQFDDNGHWCSRTEAERDAMMTLALDEYYGTMAWDEDVTIPILPA